jgi:lysozyme family protein
MKKLCLLILLLHIYINTQEATPSSVSIFIEQETSFQKAFKRIHALEGYYANDPDDKGGETYRGIARNFNRTWIGWYRIDQYKKTHRVRWNQQIEDADFLVLDYYLSIWVKEGFDNIHNHTLAAYVFDFRIHGNSAVRIMRRELKLPINSTIDSTFINALNKTNSTKYIKQLRKQRLIYYENIVKRDSTQIKWLKGWKIRAI